MFYIDGYQEYETQLAIREVNTDGRKTITRLRVFPYVKYKDFHIERETNKKLYPILPWEMLVNEEYLFVKN